MPSNLWDGTYGAWSRGDYLSAGETVGGIVGIPLPLAKVGYFGKFRALDNVVADNPLVHLGNASAPDIRARLTEASAILRRDPDLPLAGNIGFAEVDIPAISKTPYILKAYSGFDDSIGSFIPKPAGSLDTWILSPKVASRRAIGPGPYSYLRDVDTEFKILETTAQRLGSNSMATGRINLFSERAICPSCDNVVGQFKARYPNIQLNVFTGN